MKALQRQLGFVAFVALIVLRCGGSDSHLESERQQSESQQSEKQQNASDSFSLSASANRVDILELKYFPATGTMLDSAVTGLQNWSLARMRERVVRLSRDSVSALNQSSAYVGSKTGTDPFLDYRILATKEFLSPVPVRYSNAGRAHFPDHFKISQTVNFCDYVDRLGVRDIWIWMYHKGTETVPIESNMSMGTQSRAFFNQGSYGDISNSYLENDLPQCRNTYVVYEFNYEREVAEVLHNYGHHRERIFGWADGNLWQSRFVSPIGNSAAMNGCGNVHFPPNGLSDYDYANRASVSSSCSQWSLEDAPKAESVSCTLWACDHETYQLWWAKRIPGFGNAIWNKGDKLRNFNRFFFNFDQALANGGRRLLLPLSEILKPVNPNPAKVSVFDEAQKKWIIQAVGSSANVVIDAVYHLPTAQGQLVFVTGKGRFYSIYDVYQEAWTSLNVSTAKESWPASVTSAFNEPGSTSVVFASDFGRSTSRYDFAQRKWTEKNVATSGWPANITATYAIPNTSSVVFMSDRGARRSVYDYALKRWTSFEQAAVGSPQKIGTAFNLPDTTKLVFLH